MKKTNRKYWIIGASLLLLIPLVGMSSAGSAMAKPINSSRLRKSKYASYAPWIEAMAKHESANYTSTLAKEANNIFGMGYPTRRPAANEGHTEYKVEGQYMSVYKNYDQAIEDFLLWLEADGFPENLETVDQFVEQLKNPRGIASYFGDSTRNYLNGMKSWL